MTQIEISKYLDIPFTTLNDWKKENSNRNKLYQLLINLDKNLVENILNKQNNHRFFHILNRNIDSEKITYEDIKNAFSKRDIKAIYISSPFRNINGVAKKWDKRFRLSHIDSNLERESKIPTALQNILNKKNLTNI